MEDYTYINDTIVVEPGAFLKKYVKNANGNIIYEKNQPKTNNQVYEIVYKYSDSSIVVHGTNNYSDKALSILYQINDKYKVVMKQTINDKTNYSKEFIFDARGLLAEIIGYKNGHQMSKTKIEYSYF
ncbi:MAG: hypothetical protein L3J41_05360 [Melioribacteraceae bacterium]|nr:hypothetical protein [Melioribacteraceae bacterium]